MLHADVTSVSEWVHACSSAFVPLRVRAARLDFQASLEQVELAPGVTLTAVTSHASEVVRDREVIAASPREDILLSLHRRGSGAVSQHNRTARLTPGGCAVYDASTPYTLSFPGQMSEIVLQLPRDTIGRSGHAFEDLTARLLQPSASLHALTALAGSVDPTTKERSLATDEAVAESLASLLRSSLVQSDPFAEPPLEAELLAGALQLHIDEYAADPEMTPEALAATFHLSLRYVQKLFEQHVGIGVSTCIRLRRLELAQHLLRQRIGVAETAHRSGFLDVDTFSRAFKREFGTTPSRFS